LSSLDNFYDEISLSTAKEISLDAESKAIVLFRVAIQTGVAELGVEKVLHMMNKLIKTTISIMAEDESASYVELLSDWDKSEVTKH
tara:strand:- start:618 stop:875 length:258 start_codon:yes stop_codon:yes gene_type:complete